MKKLTAEEKSSPLTISIPKYMHTWMKENLRHGEASKIMYKAIEKKMADEQDTI